MKEFDRLWEVATRLNNEKTGCAWDVEQTFDSLQKYIIEEAAELVEAVDGKNLEDIKEELGDFIYVGFFYCKVAERQKLFSLADVLSALTEKLVRRHPHVFGKDKTRCKKEIERMWLEVKAEEKSHRKSLLDGVPKELSALLKAEKVLKSFEKVEYPSLEALPCVELSEEKLGNDLLDLVSLAIKNGLDPEKALRKSLDKHIDEFKQWETSKACMEQKD